MRLLLYTVCFALCLSCSEAVIKKPENLIPKDTMASILYDLAIIQAARTTNPKILEENQIEPMEYLYEKYRIDSVQFVQSDTYYASRPQEYEALYKIVESRLEREKEVLEEVRKQSNDSARLEMEAKRQENALEIRKKAQDSIP